MKKTSWILGTIILAFTLSSCTGSDVDALRMAPISIVGKIESLQVSKDVPGTHKLATDYGDEYYLKSKDYDLSLYNDKIMKIEGILSVANGFKIIQVSDVLEPSDESSGYKSESETLFKFIGIAVNFTSTWIVNSNDITKIASIKIGTEQIAEVSKEEGKGFEPDKWLSVRGYQKPERLSSSNAGSLYQVSPLNLYIFTSKSDIYHIVLKSPDAKLRDYVIQKFKLFTLDDAGSTDTEKSAASQPKPFPEASTTPAPASTSALSKEVTKETSKQVYTTGEGMRKFENVRYGLVMDYPKNWYYQGLVPGGDESLRVLFTPKTTETVDTIELRLYKTKSAPDTSSDASKTYFRRELGQYVLILSTPTEDYKKFLSPMASSAVIN